jgi:replicative DNA helicase
MIAAARTDSPRMESPRADRLPPQDIVAEKSFLGAICLEPTILDECPELITEGEFYADDHRKIYAEMQRQRGSGILPAPESVAESLAPTLGKDTVVDLLLEAMESIPHTSHWRFYCRTIRERALRRAMIAAGGELMRSGYDHSADTDDAIAAGDRAIRMLSEGQVANAAIPAREVAVEYVAQMSSPNRRATATGFVHLDAILAGGVRPQQLVIVAARPSVGKSAFAGCIAANVARDGTPVLFITMEMPARDLFSRLVCREARFTQAEIDSQTMPEYQMHAVMQGVDTIANLPILIDERAGRTVSQIAALSRMHKARDGIGMIVVDYLQLISSDNRRGNRQEVVAEISRELKLMAKNLDIPVIALAQLSREIEKREDKRPKMSDLRESGGIENDADLILFLDRPSQYDSNEPKDKAVLYVGKNRGGQCGDVRLIWDGRWFRFDNDISEYTA